MGCGVIIMIQKEDIQSVTKNYFADSFVSYSVVLISDSTLNISVPLDENNTDYQEILEWVAEGNTITDNGGSE
jgi:hypothetical protein